MNALNRLRLSVLVLALATACGSVSPEDEALDDAHRAYLGLETSIHRSIGLALQGYGATMSEDITPQSTGGELAGILTLTGRVELDDPANTDMLLQMMLEDYSDAAEGAGSYEERLEAAIIYTTDVDAQPAFNLSLRDIPEDVSAPNGTFTGSVGGDFEMAGALEGKVRLYLSLSGELISHGPSGIHIGTGTTRVTGTATIINGSTFDVDVSL